MLVKDMTDQQLNRVLAELSYNAQECSRDTDSRVVIIGDFGTYNTHPLTGDWKKAKWRDTAEEAWADIPGFSSDSAASLEVQARAIELDAEGYVLNLSNQVAESLLRKTTSPYYGLVSRMLNASPRERAEAAYMTLSSKA